MRRFGSSASPEPPRGKTVELGDGEAVWTVSFPPTGRASSTLSPSRPRARIRRGEGDDVFSVPVDVARDVMARCGAEGVPPSGPAMASLVGRSSAACCAKRLAAMVDRRDYSVREATDKLVDRGYPRPVVADVVERARAGRLLDDARFSEAFIRAKVAAGWGPLRIERELARRGVDASSVEGWPDAFIEPGSEFDRAWELVSRRRVPDKNPYAKTVRFLVSRGFSYAVAKACAERVADGPAE